MQICDRYYKSIPEAYDISNIRYIRKCRSSRFTIISQLTQEGLMNLLSIIFPKGKADRKEQFDKAAELLKKTFGSFPILIYAQKGSDLTVTIKTSFYTS